MAYHAIDTKQVDEQTQHDCKMHGPVALTKVIGEFKTHRCAFDFDHKFVMSAWYAFDVFIDVNFVWFCASDLWILRTSIILLWYLMYTKILTYQSYDGVP